MKSRRLACMALSILVSTTFALIAQAAPSIQQIMSEGEKPAHGRIGAAAVIFASGLEDPVSILFSDGQSGTVQATDLTIDLDRGIVGFRIPAGAATGPVQLSANGVNADP